MGTLRPWRECEQDTFAFEVYMINVKFSDVLSEGQRNIERGGIWVSRFFFKLHILKN